MSKTRRICILASLLGFLAASAALAASREVALGADGEIYTVRVGEYGELFPKGRDFDRANVVLALDIVNANVKSSLQRLLVPGTGGAEVEKSPSILFEEDSETVFLVWETSINIHPILQLAGFDGKGWSKPIEVIGNPFAAKTSPQFTTTRDSYEETGLGGSTVTHHRTVLHLVWREETASGAWTTLYSPILINDGEYSGVNPIYDLDEYLQESVTPVSSEVQAALAQAPIIEAGRDERTVVAAYASTTTGRMSVVEVDVLPEQLTRLADKARQHIIDLGREINSSSRSAAAAKARQHIVDLGHAFRPEVVKAMADDVRDLILAGGNDAVESLANKARQHIVDLGAQLSGRGLRSAKGADATARLVEVAPDPAAVGDPGSFIFQLRVVSSLPAPPAGAGAVRLFVSKTGEDLIVSWAEADKVVYRNSRDTGWTETRELRLGENFDLAKAYEVLEQRLRNR